MSFILDALKKSELERQRQATPGLIDVGTARVRPALPPWALALGALLAINLVVLGVMLLRHSGTAAPPSGAIPGAAADAAPGAALGATPDVPAGTAPREPVAASAADHFSPMDGAPTYAPEVPVAESVGSAPEMAPVRPTARRSAPVAKAADVKPEEDTEEVLPTLSELSSSATQGLPELHLDVHVFATVPADRFVFINGRKYHEGMKLQEGPLLERIRRDGIVLNYQGVRFLLPRE